MAWISLYGTGATIHGIKSDADGRVEFTVWLSALWVPLIPISSWSAQYVGELPPGALTDEGHAFTDLKRIPHDWLRLLGTFVRGLLFGFVIAAPAVYLVWRTEGRAATTLEMVFLLASVVWFVGLIIWRERMRKRQLKRRVNE